MSLRRYPRRTRLSCSAERPVQASSQLDSEGKEAHVWLQAPQGAATGPSTPQTFTPAERTGDPVGSNDDRHHMDAREVAHF